MAATSSNLTGWLLMKKESLLWKTWKKRFFREADVVVFFSKLQDEAATDKIWLDQIIAVTPLKDDGKFTITLKDGTKYKLDALSSEYRDVWMKIFNKKGRQNQNNNTNTKTRWASADSIHTPTNTNKKPGNNNNGLSSSNPLPLKRTQHNSFSREVYNNIPTEQPENKDRIYNNIPNTATAPIIEDEIPYVPPTRLVYNNIPSDQPPQEAPDSPSRKRNHDKIPSKLEALSIVLSD